MSSIAQTVRDERKAFAASMYSDVQIIYANRLAPRLEGGANAPIVRRGPRILGENTKAADEIFNHGKVTRRVVA